MSGGGSGARRHANEMLRSDWAVDPVEGANASKQRRGEARALTPAQLSPEAEADTGPARSLLAWHRRMALPSRVRAPSQG